MKDQTKVRTVTILTYKRMDDEANVPWRTLQLSGAWKEESVLRYCTAQRFYPDAFVIFKGNEKVAFFGYHADDDKFYKGEYKGVNNE